MSTAEVLQPVMPARPAESRWASRLAVCLTLVFWIGVPTILLARWVFWSYRPFEFHNDSPSISETAAQTPAIQVFKWGILAVVACIFVSWTLELLMNLEHLRNRRSPGMAPVSYGLVGFAWFLGVTAGVFLGVIAFCNLAERHDIHMFSSWVFYLSQVFADIVDTIAAFWLARVCLGLDGTVSLVARRLRLIVTLTLFTGSMLLLHYFLAKNHVPHAQRLDFQKLYVESEYLTAILCFLYPVAMFAEVRDFYRVRAQMPAPDAEREAPVLLVAEEGVA